jgi:hypothetical protein
MKVQLPELERNFENFRFGMLFKRGFERESKGRKVMIGHR